MTFTKSVQCKIFQQIFPLPGFLSSVGVLSKDIIISTLSAKLMFLKVSYGNSGLWWFKTKTENAVNKEKNVFGYYQTKGLLTCFCFVVCFLHHPITLTLLQCHLTILRLWFHPIVNSVFLFLIPKNFLFS